MKSSEGAAVAAAAAGATTRLRGAGACESYGARSKRRRRRSVFLLTKPCRTRIGDEEWRNGRRAATQDPSTNDAIDDALSAQRGRRVLRLDGEGGVLHVEDEDDDPARPCRTSGALASASRALFNATG